MTSFNITNESASEITITSLDNISIAPGATADIFSPSHGKFTLEDVIGNEEIQNLLDAGTISITDVNNGSVVNLRLYFGIIPIKIEPPTLTAHVDDWNPSGFSTASIVNVDLLGIKEIRGFLAGNDGDRKLIVNVSAYELKLKYNYSSSLPENRILTVEQADYKIQKFGAAEVIYDKSVERWRVIDKIK